MSNININKQADFNDFVFLKNFIAFKDIILLKILYFEIQRYCKNQRKKKINEKKYDLMNLPHKNVADCFAIPSKKLIFVPEFQYNSNTEQHIELVNKKN